KPTGRKRPAEDLRPGEPISEQCETRSGLFVCHPEDDREDDQNKNHEHTSEFVAFQQPSCATEVTHEVTANRPERNRHPTRVESISEEGADHRANDRKCYGDDVEASFCLGSNTFFRLQTSIAQALAAEDVLNHAKRHANTRGGESPMPTVRGIKSHPGDDAFE